jgi:hypothetical protein
MRFRRQYAFILVSEMAYDVRFFFFCEKNAHESIGGEIQMPSAKILAQKEEQLQELFPKFRTPQPAYWLTTRVSL